MALYSFEGMRPEIRETAYVHPDAVLIGDVRVGCRCFIGAGAVLRGDFGGIRVGDGSNVQENCVVHVSPNSSVIVEEDVVIGHGAILHDVKVRSRAVVGMGAVLLQGAVVEEEAMVGAGAVVSTGFVVPSRKIAAGNPARIRKALPDAYLEMFRAGLALYQELPERYRKGLRRVPLQREGGEER